MDKKLKIGHKAIMIYEAAYIYIKRHNLNIDIDTFVENDYVWAERGGDLDKEIDNMCEDLRCFRQGSNTYTLKEITVEEYEDCVDNYPNL